MYLEYIPEYLHKEYKVNKQKPITFPYIIRKQMESKIQEKKNFSIYNRSENLKTFKTNSNQAYLISLH